LRQRLLPALKIDAEIREKFLVVRVPDLHPLHTKSNGHFRHRAIRANGLIVVTSLLHTVTSELPAPQSDLLSAR